MRFSVVVPTYQRRELVTMCVQSLAAQEGAPAFEVLVVVDGSTDGSAAALRALRTPFELHVIVQPNRGASAARNAGAERASGEILVFLDDDMEADPGLLREHDRLHLEGAEAVLGHMPVHPDSPPGVLTDGVAAWAQRRAERLSVPDAPIALGDLLTGQLSIGRRTFEALGGFDTGFTRGGSFGAEDTDFGYRLVRAGRRVVFSASAISRQRYTTTPRQNLRQWREAGRAQARLSRKHPELACEIAAMGALNRRWRHRLLEPLAGLPGVGGAVSAAARTVALAALRRRPADAATRLLFATARELQYLRGIQEGGGLCPGGSVAVLAYHDITPPGTAGAIDSWAVSPERLAAQLDALSAAGYRCIDLDALLGGLAGTTALPQRAVLVTFDDCCESLSTAAAPLLEQRGLPALAFAVSARLGGTNDWDELTGLPPAPLLDAARLRRLGRRGIEIGAHSRTHPVLPALGAADLALEVEGSRTELEQAGLPAPRAFAYPYGRHDDGVVAAVARAGFAAAFTMDSGIVRPGCDPYRLPRIELRRGDTAARLRLKLAIARAPAPLRHLVIDGRRLATAILTAAARRRASGRAPATR